MSEKRKKANRDEREENNRVESEKSELRIQKAESMVSREK